MTHPLLFRDESLLSGGATHRFRTQRTQAAGSAEAVLTRHSLDEDNSAADL